MSSTKAKRRIFALPDSLFGQLLAILFFGVVILQASNFMVVCHVQKLYVVQAEKSRAEQLVTCWHLLSAMTADQREAALSRLNMARGPEETRLVLEMLEERPDWPLDIRGTERVLRQTEENFTLNGAEVPDLVMRVSASGGRLFPVYLPVLETAMRLADGTWLKITQPFDVDDRAVVWPQRLFVLLEGLVMLVLTALFVLRVTRPIQELSRAAASFGRHPELSRPFPEKGVREVRDAAQSFNRMCERICGSLAERDRMIAAMAHDLRTPLTRLKLRLDRVDPQALREKMAETVSEIQAIISQGLELARSLNTEEPMTRLDVKAFVQSLADDHADMGHKVSLAVMAGTDDTPPLLSRPGPCV